MKMSRFNVPGQAATPTCCSTGVVAVPSISITVSSVLLIPKAAVVPTELWAFMLFRALGEEGKKWAKKNKKFEGNKVKISRISLKLGACKDQFS